MAIINKDATSNPANAPTPAAPASERKRIPMSLPKAKLGVPKIPGYHLHWIADRQGRLMQAVQAGYEFVTEAEVGIQDFGLGNDASRTANTDMGTRVSVIGGAGMDPGTTERLYLMKQKEEWWKEDQKVLQERNQSVMQSIKRDGLPAEGQDNSQRYVKKADFSRKTFG